MMPNAPKSGQDDDNAEHARELGQQPRYSARHDKADEQTNPRKGTGADADSEDWRRFPQQTDGFAKIKSWGGRRKRRCQNGVGVQLLDCCSSARSKRYLFARGRLMR